MAAICFFIIRALYLISMFMFWEFSFLLLSYPTERCPLPPRRMQLPPSLAYALKQAILSDGSSVFIRQSIERHQ